MKASEVKYWGMTKDGRRYVLGTGLGCVDCGEFIEKRLVNPSQEPLCPECTDNRRDAILILQEACTRVSREVSDIPARCHLYHAIWYLENSEQYDREVSLAEIQTDLRNSALIRHIQQQRDAGAKKISWDGGK